MAARFEVRDIFEVTQRGRVVTGTILSGQFRIGMRVWAEDRPSLTFTISGVEFVDDIGARQAWVAFVSTDAPSLAQLRHDLPAGAVLRDTQPEQRSANAAPIA
jgi:hypothetical protein